MEILKHNHRELLFSIKTCPLMYDNLFWRNTLSLGHQIFLMVVNIPWKSWPNIFEIFQNLMLELETTKISLSQNIFMQNVDRIKTLFNFPFDLRISDTLCLQTRDMNPGQLYCRHQYILVLREDRPASLCQAWSGSESNRQFKPCLAIILHQYVF